MPHSYEVFIKGLDLNRVAEAMSRASLGVLIVEGCQEEVGPTGARPGDFERLVSTIIVSMRSKQLHWT
jgi:hypothetical protein